MKHRESAKDTLAAKATRALGWNFVSTALSKLGGLGISIMLARLLGPHAFGAYAVALVALIAMQTFNELGMSLAIVRWETDPRDIIPTITTVSVLVSVVTYAGCFWLAPAFAAPWEHLRPPMWFGCWRWPLSSMASATPRPACCSDGSSRARRP